MTDHRFPLCSKLGVLRKVYGGLLAVSTSELLTQVGWKKYQTFLPYMQHGRVHVTPESCESWLATLNRK